jgi:hypothetical protein
MPLCRVVRPGPSVQPTARCMTHDGRQACLYVNLYLFTVCTSSRIQQNISALSTLRPPHAEHAAKPMSDSPTCCIESTGSRVAIPCHNLPTVLQIPEISYYMISHLCQEIHLVATCTSHHQSATTYNSVQQSLHNQSTHYSCRFPLFQASDKTKGKKRTHHPSPHTSPT